MQVCPFIEFLTACKASFTNITSKTNTPLHLVLGNESCDLDSTACTLAFAYFVQKNDRDAVVLPVINTNRDGFLVRTLNCYVLSELGINIESLVFRNEVDLDRIRSNLTTSLVDHHVMCNKDECIKGTVKQIVDHRPLDKSVNWGKDVVLNITQVGSCATLIADKHLKLDKPINKTVGTLLYYTIVFDTAALVDNGKTTQFDKITAEKLRTALNITTDVKDTYERLWKVYTDVSKLTPAQLLTRDMKVVEGIPLPGLPMLVAQFLRLPEAENALTAFASEKGVALVILMGIQVTDDVVKRDVAVFSLKCDKRLLNLVLRDLVESECSEGIKLGLVREYVADCVMYFRQENIKATRKQIIPLVKGAVLKYQGGNK